MAGEAPADKRDPRIDAHLPVRLSTIDAERDPWSGRPFFRSARAWSGNVSRGGLFVRTPEPLAPGRRVLVELSLPGGALEAMGRVAWSRRALHPDGRVDDEAGVGLQFIGASGDQMTRLERYLRERQHRASRRRGPAAHTPQTPQTPETPRTRS